jgi:4-amino-4-deoxy-L-arabinose transferase-like glycosyltransferase
MVALVLYVIVRGLAAAVTKPLWLDELYTLTVSSQPSLRALWAVLARAMDGQPPGFYAVERVVSALIQNKEIALRLPAILAFPCTLVCVFVFVKKRSGELIAFLCAFLLLATILFQRYAVEARPYSILVACIAFALVCYQRLPSLFWTAMLGIRLALAQALHYYAVFAIVPFAWPKPLYSSGHGNSGDASGWRWFAGASPWCFSGLCWRTSRPTTALTITGTRVMSPPRYPRAMAHTF